MSRARSSIANGVRRHNRHVTSRFGMAPGEYDEMLTLQGGVCAACGRPERVTARGNVRRLVVDHDHATGEVRALLCDRCNRTLGHAGEEQHTLISVLGYLMRRVA